MSQEEDNLSGLERAQIAREEQLVAAVEKISGWPLDRRETFAALVIMGLASRLQPIHLDSVEHQKRVVTLSFKLADLAILACEEK